MAEKGGTKRKTLEFYDNRVLYLLIPTCLFLFFVYFANGNLTGNYNVFRISSLIYILFFSLYVIMIFFLKLSLKYKAIILIGFLIISISGIVNASIFDNTTFKKDVDIDENNQVLGKVHLKKGLEYSLYEIMIDRTNSGNAPHYLEIIIISEDGNTPLYFKENRCMFDDMTYLTTFTVNKTNNYLVKLNFSIKEGWSSSVESVSIIIKENNNSQYTLHLFIGGIIIIIIGTFYFIIENKYRKKLKLSKLRVVHDG